MTAPSQPSHVSIQPDTPVRTAFEVVVPLAQGTPCERTLRACMTGWIFPPSHVPVEGGVALWYLAIPGATSRGRSYFDRHVPGAVPEAFSMARFLAKQGIGLIVINTLGTGESEIQVDGELITCQVTAEANAQVLHHVRERLTSGTLVADLDAVAEKALFLGGFGHALGAVQLTHLAARLQELGKPLDAVILAGWSHAVPQSERIGMDLAAIVTTMTETSGDDSGGRLQMRSLFSGPEPSVPKECIDVDERQASRYPTRLLLEGLRPRADLAAALHCPVLQVLAPYDVSTSAPSEGPTYPSSRLFTAYTQPRAAHGNVEATRHEYWRIIVRWTYLVAALRFPFHLLPGEGLV